MSYAIHHGPPGSYKTFTLVQRHAIDALKAGRVVVTNIRGFNDIELIKKAFPKLKFPESASIISIDTRTQEGLLLLARWFHWVPFGALILVDEAQAVYPMRSDFKLENLDHFEGLQGFEIETIFNGEQRPRDIHLAFDMHRHFGWDLFLSTPNVAKINKIIRQSAEWAYKHRDISGLLPWYKNKWVEVQHDPESSGKSITSRVGVPTKYTADLQVFKCYSSTATGTHKGSEAGRSVFKDPKILAVTTVTFLSIFLFFYLLFNSTSSIANLSDTADISKKDDRFSHSKNTLQASHDVNHSSQHSIIHKTPNLVAVRRSVSERSRTATYNLKLLKRFQFLGVNDSDYDVIPDSCTSTPKKIKCRINRKHLASFTNTVCFNLFCYAYFKRNQSVGENDFDNKQIITNSFPFS